MGIWNILGIMAIAILVISTFTGRIAMWGSLTLGIAVALAVAFLYVIKGEGFSWFLFRKIIIISIYVGVFFEAAGKFIKSPKRVAG